MKINLNKLAETFLKIVKEIGKKINDPVLRLGFGFSIIMGLIAVLTQQFPEFLGNVFVELFLIAVIYSLVTKILRKVKRS